MENVTLSRKQYLRRMKEIESEHTKNTSLIKELTQKNIDLTSEQLRLIKTFYGTEFEKKP